MCYQHVVAYVVPVCMYLHVLFVNGEELMHGRKSRQCSVSVNGRVMTLWQDGANHPQLLDFW